MKAITHKFNIPLVESMRVPLSYFSGEILKRSDKGQKNTHTAFDRYPDIFAAVKAYTAPTAGRKRRILSYGCSTGDECFTLRKYFPGDEIYGCDINQSVLDVARARSQTKDINFFYSSPEALNRFGPFDIVFCMSSLCYFPDANMPHRENTRFPFSRFEENIKTIDANLAKDGILVVYNSNYNFLRTKVSASYDVIYPDTVYENGYVNKFHENSRPYTVTIMKSSSYCHKVVSDAGNFTDDDFKHCIYQKNTNGGRQFKQVQMSPALDSRCEVLSSYVVADDDIFKGEEQLIPITLHIDILRAPNGDIYEKVDVKKPSISYPGQQILAGSFVRAFKY